MTHPVCLTVAVATPTHSALSTPLSYASAQDWPPGQLLRVPLGARDVLGVVWDHPGGAAPDPGERSLRAVVEVWDALPPLDAHWRALVAFAARYYQRSVGEMALAALPPAMRTLNQEQLARRLAKLAPKAPAPRRRTAKASQATASETALATAEGSPAAPGHGADQPLAAREVPPALTLQQREVLQALSTQPGTFLLHGNTGSGKTEVYMQAAAQALAQNAHAQVLVLVPEINLTPQLQARFERRFGADAVVAMHSALTPAKRLSAWLRAHLGQARIVLGTRMAVFASLPGLALIVVDEEHDPSYKQQEGARYSARDLAVWRGHHAGVRVLLGSATPSLESWWASRPASPAAVDDGTSPAAGRAGRYTRLHMPDRIGSDTASAALLVRRVDMNHQPRGAVLAPPLLDAIGTRAARGEQSLLLLNRRGYSPVLSCSECGWKSTCPHCSAYRVFHKGDRSLRCHHCGLASPVPHACPDCGNPDIQGLGRGTEQLQEQVQALLSDMRRPDGSALRIARLDADTTRLKGTLTAQLDQVHAGEVDVLIGTQMIAKGHDFRRVSLVAAVQPDAALFASDFRAPERLFALLMQAAGRAGRDAGFAQQPEMWVQTHQPAHPLYAALKTLDYAAFADGQLTEREQAGLPPFVHQALLRADARTQEAAQGFLLAAVEALRDAAMQQPQLAPLLDAVYLYPAVPLTVQRVAQVERAQLLLESTSRQALQRLMHAWQPLLHRTRADKAHKALIRWLFDVDPLGI
ncbi:primosomal protein N' [Comamonas serinivorans]|uniref:Replication restart protein PriA n=1 Tax=Comamonas serinivorans TaxID=1082851 RepID=A0A1Y0ESC1_9BURK|nr:primosomal protein N' [Comamonas serinivorans]ARU06408.1 primosomal protein N' [Comamonas serinivorans]